MLHMYNRLSDRQKDIAVNALTTAVGAAVGVYLATPGETGTELVSTVLKCAGAAHIVRLAVNVCQEVKELVTPARVHAHRM